MYRRFHTGNIYGMLAEAYLEVHDVENALAVLEKLWEIEKMASSVFDGRYKLKTPLFEPILVKWYCPRNISKEEAESILMLLQDSRFDSFCDDARYVRLVKETESALSSVRS